MTEQQITNGNIYQWAAQIHQWNMSGSVFVYFFRQQIQTFYHVNERRLEYLTKRLVELDEKHLIHDAQGNILMTGQGKQQQPAYKSPEDEKAYTTAVRELMEAPATLKLVTP